MPAPAPSTFNHGPPSKQCSRSRRGRAFIKQRRNSEAFFIRAYYLFPEAFDRVRPHQIDGAASKSAAGHPRSLNALEGDDRLHQKIQLLATDFIIMLHAPV